MACISNIYESTSSLFNGIDAKSLRPLNFKRANKHVQKLFIEGAKIGVGIAGFIAASYLMNQQASSLAAAGVCAVALGGSRLVASRFSIFFFDAIQISTALVVFQKGFLNLIAFPALSSVIGSVKGLGEYSITKEALNLLVSPAVSSAIRSVNGLGEYSVTTGVCRFVGGMFSLSLAFSLADNGSPSLLYTDGRNLCPQKHLIDRGITAMIDLIAYIFTRILGY